MAGDLTEQVDVDAIVGAITPGMRVDGSLNQALIHAAGAQLDDFILENIFKPRPGDVFMVPSFNLKVRHLIFTVTPEWEDAIQQEDRDLTRCYRGVMQLAQKYNIRTIAFPALATGQGKFPPQRAGRIAIGAILQRMTPDFDDVRIVCNKPDILQAFQAAYKNFT